MVGYFVRTGISLQYISYRTNLVTVLEYVTRTYKSAQKYLIGQTEENRTAMEAGEDNAGFLKQIICHLKISDCLRMTEFT